MGFFFRKKMAGWVNKVKIQVRFVTSCSTNNSSSEWIKGDSVFFTSSNKHLNKDRDWLKLNITLYQILTGSDYNFKTTDILKKKNNDGSITIYLRFKLMSGLYGYISQNDLSDVTRTEYKMYLSTNYYDLQPVFDSEIDTSGKFFIFKDKEGIKKSIIYKDKDDNKGAYCHIGINDYSVMKGGDLITFVGDHHYSIIDDNLKDVLQLELYTNPYYGR